MATEYDKKFEEMKQYIPFLDSMISRLELCNSSDNPRKAQLNKIKALRDLLLEKNKKMKMENLNKCEQVLKNLYAKIEQSDTLISSKSVSKSVLKQPYKEDFMENDRSFRNTSSPKSHLRSVCSVVQNNPEGVLFHRRPKRDLSLDSDVNKSFEDISSRRNYTRVLVSPETNRALYHRRSPPKTSSRSPIQSHKKSKKSSKRRSHSRKPKDINITINVPDKSLNSLNAEDILDRITKCDDNDVDINILQTIRDKLSHELKQTGINSDVTNFILQSYGNKKKKKKKYKEYEEGELSDSESEFINGVYDNIVTDFQVISEGDSKDKMSKNSSDTGADSEALVRKIKINFTISNPNTTVVSKPESKISECSQTIVSSLKTKEEESKSRGSIVQKENDTISTAPGTEPDLKNDSVSNSDPSKENSIRNQNSFDMFDSEKIDSIDKNINISRNVSDDDVRTEKSICNESSKQTENKANFYTPLANTTEIRTKEIQSSFDNHGHDSSNTVVNFKESENETKNNITKNISPKKDESHPDSLSNVPFVSDTQNDVQTKTTDVQTKTTDVQTKTTDAEIISHIDILAALKKDILSENLDISEKTNEVPALHQPKLIKVTGTTSSSFEMDRKKRISLEKYKEKIVPKPRLFFNDTSNISTLDEKLKKQSRGLTAKECERFNFHRENLKDEYWVECEKVDESAKTTESDDILAPKSPEQNSYEALDQTREPIIIPTEPSTSSVIENARFDTDMRFINREVHNLTTNPSTDLKLPIEKSVSVGTSKETVKAVSPITAAGLRDSTLNTNLNVAKTSTNCNKTLERFHTATDNSETFENTSQVRAPINSPQTPLWESSNSSERGIHAKVTDVRKSFDDKDVRSTSVMRDDSRFVQNQRNQRIRSDRDPRLCQERRSECPRTPSHHFGRSEYPQTPTHSFGRTECPGTPVHPFGMVESTSVRSFGRSGCPRTSTNSFPVAEIPKSLDISYGTSNRSFVTSEGSYTPRHSFGASEIPGTPLHSFGSSEIPSTPRHSFGSSEIPGTPRHPFGSSEIPGTPRHPFGSSEIPGTPRHPFGASEASGTHRHQFAVSEMPGTPRHTFSALEMPGTPHHSFGSSEILGTPRHAFGSSEIPGTPRHPFGGSEMPGTPRHSFGASEMPGTPRHSFGASEMPGTPHHSFADVSSTSCHSFGYSEIPPSPYVSYGTETPGTPNRPFTSSDISRTPIHMFGASDMPNTPIHPIGQLDYAPFKSDCPATPGHPFGRSSTNYSNESKYDSPLNHNSKPLGNEISRYDPRPYRPQNITRSHSEHYINDKNNRNCNREQSVGPNDFQRDYGHERGRTSQRQFREASVPRRENSVGRHVSEDYRQNRSYSREQSMANSHLGSFESIRMRNNSSNHDHQRESSVGRVAHINENIHRNESGFSQNFGPLNVRNTLDVESHAGRSFTIDTSINRTFQAIQKSDFDFDDRRRRASSVGRSHTCNVPTNDHHFGLNNHRALLENRNDFRRARSIGREFELNPKTEKGKIREFNGNHGTSVENRNDFRRARSIGRELEPSLKTQKGKICEFDGNHRTLVENRNDFRRARSIGREFESSSKTEKGKIREFNSNHGTSVENRNDFRRARSIGRELEPSLKTQKGKICEFDGNHRTLVENRNEFRCARSIERKFELSSKTEKGKILEFVGSKQRGNLDEFSNIVNTKSSRTNSKPLERDQRQSKESFKYIDPRNKESSSKSQRERRNDYHNGSRSSSPRYNQRDPRLRKFIEERDNPNKYQRSNERNHSSRKSGIVYTNDNISKGTVLGTGVKNYRIPKIKRVSTENERNDSDDSSAVKIKDATKSKTCINTKDFVKNKDSKRLEEGSKNKYSCQKSNKDNTNEYVTPKCDRNSNDFNDGLPQKYRKGRVRKLSSDSESENVETDLKVEKDKCITSSATNTNSLEFPNVKGGSNTHVDENMSLKTTCTTSSPVVQNEYDLELFSDCMVPESASTPEINQLIADLDKDLDSCDNSDFTTDLRADSSSKPLMQSTIVRESQNVEEKKTVTPLSFPSQSSVEVNAENKICDINEENKTFGSSGEENFILSKYSENQNNKLDNKKGAQELDFVLHESLTVNTLSPDIKNNRSCEENIVSERTCAISEENIAITKCSQIHNDKSELEKMAQNPEKVAQNPEKAAQNPEKVAQNPEKAAQNSEKVKQNPEKVAQNPEKVAQNQNFEHNLENTSKALEQSPVVSSPQKDKTYTGSRQEHETIITCDDKLDNSEIVNKGVSDTYSENEGDNKNTLLNEDDKGVTDMSSKNESDNKITLLKEDDNMSTVSTTSLENQGNTENKSNERTNSFETNNSEIASVPDSTINTWENQIVSEDKITDTLPDSTNDNSVALDCNLTVQPTLPIESDNCESNDVNSSQNKLNIDSMSNFLTILQGKSKIKEFLSILTENESPETEKIRRKLQKLSEIVSDEEESDNPVISFDNKSTLLQKETENEILEDSHKHGSPGISKETVHVKDGSDKMSKLPKSTLFKKRFKRKAQRKSAKCKANAKTLISKPTDGIKRKTRSETATKNQISKKKSMNRELMNLHEDIKEMFIKDDVLNATGIRMCRLAKLVDDDVTTKKKNSSDDVPTNKLKAKKHNDSEDKIVTKNDLECNLLVVLEKVSNNISTHTEEVNLVQAQPKPARKKPGPKPKVKILPDDSIPTKNEDSIQIAKDTKTVKYKPGPLSKTKHLRKDGDSYSQDSNNTEISNKTLTENLSSSDSESEALASLKKDINTDNVKDNNFKVKRRKRCWRDGVIKTNKKKKTNSTQNRDFISSDTTKLETNSLTTSVNDSFTDKDYCFYKNQSNYACKLCDFVGSNIVHHYKHRHSHEEVPISKINPKIASEAIKQSLATNLEEFVKISNKKHVCRFCFAIFSKGHSSIYSFFWHILSKHTGEYEQPCIKCPDPKNCNSKLTKPNPPDKGDGILLGYICGDCNYTQISLDNLNRHIAIRHNDRNIKVYQISLGDITPKSLTMFEKNSKLSDPSPKTNRNLRSNKKLDVSDDKSDMAETSDQISESENSYLSESLESRSVKNRPRPASKKRPSIRFEYEDTASETSEIRSADEISRFYFKTEQNEMEKAYFEDHDSNLNELLSSPPKMNTENTVQSIIETKAKKTPVRESSKENLYYRAHFMINITETGVKEYICCINGVQNHYKTTLMISLKKHIQMKHSESWDGYCCICKVIVTPLGVHKFQECLAHYLDKHSDNFPTLEDVPSDSDDVVSIPSERNESHEPENDAESVSSNAASETSRKYINVRPLSDLQARSVPEFEAPSEAESTPLRIENIVSLNSNTRSVETSRVSQSSVPFAAAPASFIPRSDTVGPDGEWMPSFVTNEKHRVVLEAMLEPIKLIQIFKCAGKFCSFTSDSAELAVVHATTHQRTGGAGAMRCSYCTFEAAGSGIDLVSHVFREHGHCQYACQLCFYRACSPTLAEEHVRIAHPAQPGPPVVLRAPLATPAAPAAASVLTRTDAVPDYVCTYGKNRGAAEQCKFRTYTFGKFWEHYKQRHPDASSYECSECGTFVEMSAEAMSEHGRAHGLARYHCTYCVYGADSDAELLRHAAHAHPARRPQAYLRHIVEAKGPDGVAKLRVLPLVHFNKTPGAALADVEAGGGVDDPVKEAARALELETLIGQTVQMIETAMAHTAAAAHPLIEPLAAPHGHEDMAQESIAADEIVEDQNRVQTSVTTSPVVGRLPTVKAEPQDDASAAISLTLAPTVVAPAPVAAAPRADVISLNSDEENDRSASDVIDISDNDEAPAGPAPAGGRADRVALADLFKCAGCGAVLKSCGGFKRHVSTCPRQQRSACAYCTFRSDDRVDLADHLLRDHGPTVVYQCHYCRHVAFDERVIGRHLLNAHGIEKPVHVEDPTITTYKKYMVRAAKQIAKPKVDRRPGVPASGGAVPPTPAPAPPRRRYGPADVDALPIAPIVDEPMSCAECDFTTKVRVNMVRHLQLHAQRQPAPSTAPVNPVPHLETNQKHFDKMTNLAASSNAARAERPARPEAAGGGRYPQYVPERSRHACGAPDCSYISVDEAMLRRHWDTLHFDCGEFRCVHCPPDQQLDPALPLTSARIVSHMRMHDARLYACSACAAYYHYQRQAVERHVADRHPLGASVVAVRQPVRDEPAAPPGPHAAAPAPEPARPSAPAVAPPTDMDLKPWQCGLCEFKSMLRPEVVEHCGLVHNSKRQYRCSACTWRGVIYANATAHCSSAHPAAAAEVLHMYYCEGSVSAGPGGVPRWLYQSLCVSGERSARASADAAPAPAAPPVDLDLVKSETPEEPRPADGAETAAALMARYDRFCEPRDGKFACPMCPVTEEARAAMTAHLYEELNYRKWSCGSCTYKTFDKARLMEHALQEHRQRQEPRPLAGEARVEAWVEAGLERQERALRPRAASPTPVPAPAPDVDLDQLQEAFGCVGAPLVGLFSCPKCPYSTKQEEEFRDHLETELAKVRWGCSQCSEKFHHYHEAQLHCKSAHSSPPARIVEASRDPERRAAWVAAVLRHQRRAVERPTGAAAPPAPDNSLLVARYEQRVSAAGHRPARRRRALGPGPADPDSDDERLVIDECATAIQAQPSPAAPADASAPPAAPPAPPGSTPNATREPEAILAAVVPDKCPICGYASKLYMTEHLAKHYNVSPYACGYCDYTGNRTAVYKHQSREHPQRPRAVRANELPPEPACVKEPQVTRRRLWTVLCLLCGARVLRSESARHATGVHPGLEPQFAEPNATVERCGVCMALRCDRAAMEQHQRIAHPAHPSPPSAPFVVPRRSKNVVIVCHHCTRRFKFRRELYAHHVATHPGLELCFVEAKAAAEPAAPGRPSASAPASEVVDVICCDESDDSATFEELAAPPPPPLVAEPQALDPESFSAGLLPTITAVTSLAPQPAAKRKLSGEDEEAGAPPRRIAKKSTTGRVQSGVRKSTACRPLYYVESEAEVSAVSEAGEAGEAEEGSSGQRAADELAHVTALGPDPFDEVVRVPIDKLGDFADIDPQQR